MSVEDTSKNTKMCPWHKPDPSEVTHDVGLYVMNSLTRKKDRFITMNGNRQVHWYMCGPTVYAPSHMGHARTYLGFDIIRRILSDYFHYDVSLVMNITDIDDKIIQRSNENGITSEALSKQFEAEFHEDMQMLGVAPPNVLTRVTEYIPEIVEYIRVIVEDKKMAYESNGSVYFDTKAFGNAGYAYCKLAPEQKDNAELRAEGEGKLTQDFIDDKRSAQDFALWKRSKEGEPSWDSPWGAGRPGWHIECSVMASRVLSDMGVPNGRMDIHSGGVDLKFPHHDNEMAQAEAHASCVQWVNYFVHSGHLHIKGFKMSKSLKNFITIRQALEQNTARQVRMCFLRHKYNAPMDYGDNTMEHAITMEKMFVEFFHNVKAVLRSAGTLTSHSQKWTAEEHGLDKSLLDCKTSVDAALRDDFDTPRALSSLAELVKSCNNYIQAKEKAGNHPNVLVVRSVAMYITKVFKVFGLATGGSGEIGFGSEGEEGDGINREEVLSPILDSLMSFRSSVREMARSNDIKGVLDQCDTFRDDALPPLGIRLEDKTAGNSVWKLDDPEVLMKEREICKAEKARKEEEKRKRLQEEVAKEALNKIPPGEYIKALTLEDGATLKYSQFSEDGMPTHLHGGEELTKGQKKTASKEFTAQKKKYEKWHAKQG
jgi:cysteinyl-tRNA synthetase